MLDDLEELRRLREEYKRASGSPGLFHVTRILFGLDGNPREGVDQEWEEFLGNVRPFEFSVDAVPGAFLQTAYFGAEDRLSEYTGLAAVTPGHFRVDTMPITFHHREARTDRNQWTLGLYRHYKRLEWHIAIDCKGAGPYSRFGMDNDDLVMLGCFTNSSESLRRYHQSWRSYLEQKGLALPKYIYAAIVTDLFKASLLVIDLHIQDIEAGKHDPKPGTWWFDEEAIVYRPSKALASDSSVGHQGQPEAAAGKIDTNSDTWPPDDGWHFRPGEFAFGGNKEKLTGKLWMLLKALAEARRPLTARNLHDVVWGHNEACTDQNLRNHLSRLRTVLRTVYDLAEDVDPIRLQPLDRVKLRSLG